MTTGARESICRLYDGLHETSERYYTLSSLISLMRIFSHCLSSLSIQSLLGIHGIKIILTLYILMTAATVVVAVEVVVDEESNNDTPPTTARPTSSSYLSYSSDKYRDHLDPSYSSQTTATAFSIPIPNTPTHREVVSPDIEPPHSRLGPRSQTSHSHSQSYPSQTQNRRSSSSSLRRLELNATLEREVGGFFSSDMSLVVFPNLKLTTSNYQSHRVYRVRR